jgi:NAD(P)-dependent dehydrogenase (short-subunit alcohol dehydrogenase family)
MTITSDGPVDPGPAPYPPVSGRLPGRVALVTGGGGGSSDVLSVGLAVSLLLAQAGARVAVLDADRSAAESAVRRIRSAGGEALALVADVRDGEACRRAVAEVVAAWGPVDTLVNNVGIGGPALAVAELADEDWERVLDVNAGSVLRVCRLVLPTMPSGGTVVNLSSAAVGRPGPATAYSASKAAVEALTRAIAGQYGARGIRANCVSPGMLWTDMVARSYPDPEQAAAARRQKAGSTVLGIEGTAWDAAYAVLFLAGPESRWITGQVLAVDAGAQLR